MATHFHPLFFFCEPPTSSRMYNNIICFHDKSHIYTCNLHCNKYSIYILYSVFFAMFTLHKQTRRFEVRPDKHTLFRRVKNKYATLQKGHTQANNAKIEICVVSTAAVRLCVCVCMHTPLLLSALRTATTPTGAYICFIYMVYLI